MGKINYKNRGKNRNKSTNKMKIHKINKNERFSEVYKEY